MLARAVAEGVGVGLALCAIGLLSLFVRRVLLQRGGGTIDLSLRLRPGTAGRGWVLGVGRFEGDDLAWYRVFSLSPRARRRLSRRDLTVLERRPPRSEERRALPAGAVVLRCVSAAGEVEVALSPSATTGLLAWLEATPPGVTLPSA